MAEESQPLVEKFTEFFETRMLKKIEDLAAAYPVRRSLAIDYAELEKFDPDLADELLASPDNIVEAAEAALAGMAATLPLLPGTKFTPHARFHNLPDKSLLIQDIGSAHIEKLVCIKGVITKRTEVWPRVMIAFYECTHCGSEYKVPFTRKSAGMSVCEECRRPVRLREDKSYFVDFQRAEVQDLLERLHGGAPASHLQLDLEDDLVNTFVPGDTVEITGIVRIRPPLLKRGSHTSGTYSKYLDVMHIQSVYRKFEEVEVSKEEEKRILELAKDPDIFEKITRSIAPSIYGHDEVKQAIALQLFGATPDKQLPEGGRIRSEIHILLIGDPGAAKSRFLQYVKDLAPKSIYVSGKSVSGVGLTASAERDELGEGGWVLKAGALVLASGGIASIDEFDKIDEAERAALHEVMESGTVSIAKAGIVARFKAETSIIAAANPKFGRFDPNKYPADQFDIPPTLLSRFDLIFPIKDILDEEKDRRLADHLLASHTAASDPQALIKLAAERTPIDSALLRKYIAYARKHFRPVLTPEANARIKEYYVELRKLGQAQGSIPITPRQIEGLIRLSEASAKSRLSPRVEVIDAERAIKLNDFVLRSIALDKTTGKLDIDIWQTGMPKARADMYSKIMRIAEELQREFDLVEIKELIRLAKEEGIDEHTAERFIQERVDRGEFYKPKHGYIKIIKRTE
ncbi:MAG: minichromosome maintenance protein MCM [Candidatus Micrarchaeia archaeon]